MSAYSTTPFPTKFNVELEGHHRMVVPTRLAALHRDNIKAMPTGDRTGERYSSQTTLSIQADLSPLGHLIADMAVG